MLYGKADQDAAAAAAQLAGTPAYANHYEANGQEAVNGHAPWISGQQSGSKQAATSAQDGPEREGPLNIFWRGQKPYEEARVGRVFNLRRPERYPAAVLEARSVHEGESEVSALCCTAKFLTVDTCCQSVVEPSSHPKEA
jgi:hypothetical protein